ncbi:lipase/acyltransferase domain-containing protein [Rhizobium ruizarguesonis]|uniref:lipase/acyltransferase domain-containing protein n=1 Tax=Rhizobium ruizarguesonis TaxID=2081791 RepID=UPI001030A1A6|nr:lecithin--cholesterol acyltransferase [Rhizobium ruizarguesonis]TBA29347.1 lecithin--cholesterol acyltransferase [Rhizobium ruizarguesonis]TBA31372.1 lecithin--cholesterol acyltransferase [Rhizobium ruizarguesonis]
MIVMLPGISGSVLQRGGRDVWAVSGQAAWRALTSGGRSLKDLRLEGGEPDGIVATRVIADAHIIPGLVKIDGYTSISRMVRSTFEVVGGAATEDHAANYIEFPYDWRLDNRVNARRLERMVNDRLRRWREYSHNPAARVIFVAHSMGGLVARYYLEVLEGWKNCRALITFGTPYRGSLNALDFLANGYKSLFVDFTEAMRSFPSVYQLLPIYEALWNGDRYFRVAEADHLPGIDPVLAADALRFHREIEEKVEENRRDPAYWDSGYAIMPIVGTRQPTKQSAILKDGKVIVGLAMPSWIDAGLDGGDGTVPRASAIPIELSDSYRNSFVPERHGSLQCNRSVLDDVKGRLEQTQVRDMRKIRGPEDRILTTGQAALSLDLEDLYLADEPITFRAKLLDAKNAFGKVHALIEPVDALVSRQNIDFVEAEDGWAVTLDGLPPGLYRIHVRTAEGGPLAPHPVRDLFEVAGAG